MAIPSRPSQLRTTSATGLIPAVKVVDVRFPAVSGGFILSSRHGGQLAWKAVPDPMRTSRWPKDAFLGRRAVRSCRSGSRMTFSDSRCRGAGDQPLAGGGLI
jgi:hypothetical protein